MHDTTTHVIFHAGCPDGRTAAWVLARALDGPFAFHPWSHGDTPPAITPGPVWVVDISFPRARLEAWAADERRVILLDHHLTAAEALAEINDPLDDTLARAADPTWRGLGVSIVMNHSGAGLAARASQVLAPDRPIPEFVHDIEDRDLWRWARPNSREVCAAFDELTAHDDSVDAIDVVARFSRTELIAIGAPAVAALDESVEEMSRAAVLVDIAGWKVPIAAVPEKRLGSFVGARLLALHPEAPFAGYWLTDPDSGLVQVGLRSTDDRVDVAHVAARFGGGGHRNSAGLACRSLADLAGNRARPR